MPAMTGNAIREALEPFLPHADVFGWRPDDFVVYGSGGMNITAGDLRRARTAYDAIGSGVKALEWSDCNSHGGRVLMGRDPNGYEVARIHYDANREAVTSPRIAAKQAAAQADFERRVLSCLSTVAVEEADAKARIDDSDEPQSFEELAEAAILDMRAYAFDEDHARRMVSVRAYEKRLRLLRTSVPSTPSPQIGKAGAGPVGEAVARDLETRAWNCSGWPTWLFEIVDRTNAVADRLDMSSEQAHAFAALSALAARPVKEPGEVERRIVEIIEPKGDENGVWCGSPLEAVIAVQNERDELRNELAETRERLENMLRPLREDLANACSSETIVRRYHVQCFDAALAALTGDVQEGGK